jgi:hypothetical protein
MPSFYVVCLFLFSASTLSWAAFVHPGVVVTRSQLDFVKTKLSQGAEPWTTALKQAKASQWGNISYKATPYAYPTRDPWYSQLVVILF